jgi:hypothetical protein
MAVLSSTSTNEPNLNTEATETPSFNSLRRFKGHPLGLSGGAVFEISGYVLWALFYMERVCTSILSLLPEV